MNPSLVPDIAQVAVLIGTAVVAMLCIGIGVWVGARRAETALIAGWGAAGLATVMAGTLTNIGLSLVMIALAAVGAGGLVRIAISVRRGTMLFQAGAMGCVAVLALPLVACSAGIETIGWDDFSHWLPNLTYLCMHDHFPTLALPSGSEHAGYPYALALPGFAIFLLSGRVPENAALSWNLIVMLCAAASIATIVVQRLAAVFPEHARSRSLAWVGAAIGLLVAGLAGPTFVPKIFFSNMADAATGSVLAVLLSIVFEWANPSRNQRARTALAITFAFGCVALIDLRQANGALFGLMMLGCALAAWKQKPRAGVGELQALAIVLLLSLGVAALWGHYAALQIPGGQFMIMPLAEWRWTLLPHTLGSIARVVLSKPGLFVLAFYLALRALLALRAGDPLTQPARAVVIVAAMVSLGMMGFLTFTYLAANFNTAEAAAAASFWRYMGEVGPLVVLATVAVVPMNWLRRLPSRPATVALLGLTIVLPLATIRLYRADLSSPVPRMRQTALAVDTAVPRSAPLTLMAMTGNGFPVVVAYYELVLSQHAQDLPARVVTTATSPLGLSAAEVAKRRFDDGQYLWLAEGTPAAAEIFGSPLSSAYSYLLERRSGRFVIVGSWPAGRRVTSPSG
jgi:hypothetical protein